MYVHAFIRKLKNGLGILAMIREAKGTELENDDGATAAVVNLPAWSAGHKRQSSASN